MADERDLRVLIVEDDPMTAEAHADFVRRVPGFVVAGTCLVRSRSAREVRGFRSEWGAGRHRTAGHEPHRFARARRGQAHERQGLRCRHHRDHCGTPPAGHPVRDLERGDAVSDQTVHLHHLPREAGEPAGDFASTSTVPAPVPWPRRPRWTTRSAPCVRSHRAACPRG